MLELIEVTKFYKKKKAVDKLSFFLEKGEIIGLAGANGAGKSTTAYMIATLDKPDSGSILFHGKDIVANPNIIRERLGYIPQDIALYESLSGLDNFNFFGKLYHLEGELLKERIYWVCDIIGFTSDMLKQRVKTYSGGMKRRLNIGVALLHQPELVIMDEPTVGIDLNSRNQILYAMKELCKLGASIVYIGHYMEEAEQICDRICVMEQGVCLLEGNLKQLLNRSTGRIRLEQLYTETINQ